MMHRTEVRCPQPNYEDCCMQPIWQRADFRILSEQSFLRACTAGLGTRSSVRALTIELRYETRRRKHTFINVGHTYQTLS